MMKGWIIVFFWFAAVLSFASTTGDWSIDVVSGHVFSNWMIGVESGITASVREEFFSMAAGVDAVAVFAHGR